MNPLHWRTKLHIAIVLLALLLVFTLVDYATYRRPHHLYMIELHEKGR